MKKLTTPAIIAARVAAPFGIDLRTLALFRVCYGFMLIVDLVTRATALRAHYTDAGVWPRSDAAAALPEFGYSLHLLGGSALFQAALFLVAGVFALLLIVGYRTRLVSILCWVMLASLNHRNYLILQTSDTLLLALLFWSIFLPWGARYSIDAALNEKRIENASVCSLASAALVVQVLSVYFFGALLKTGDAWVVSGDAVHSALHFSAYASQLGVWVGEAVPPGIQRWLTWFTYYIELYGPVLVLLPFFTAKIRLIIIPLLMLMHVGFALLLTVGIYPYLSITSLLLLIPTRFWEVLRARLSTPERAGLKIYFDAPCTFCRKVCLLLRTFLLLDTTPIEPALEQADIQKLLEEHNSWVVEDFDGQRYVRWAAMIIVFKRSWLLAPVAGVFATAPLRALGERFYLWVAANRERLGRLSSLLLPYRAIDTRLPLPVNLAVGGLLLIVVYSNTAMLKQLQLEFPWTFQRLTVALLLNQNWTMFAPEPGRSTQWLFVEGLLESGASVDVYNDSFAPPFLDKPLQGSAHFHGYRWRKYFNAISVPKHWPSLSRYYCRRWNDRHPETPVEQVLGYLLTEKTRVGIYPGEQQWRRKLHPLGSIQCH